MGSEIDYHALQHHRLTEYAYEGGVYLDGSRGKVSGIVPIPIERLTHSETEVSEHRNWVSFHVNKRIEIHKLLN